MYSNLSLRNVKRSIKDYTIYFLTLTFAVCVFYSFNSLESQSAILELSKNQSEMLAAFNKIMSAISVFISFILGFLIIYANNFLIKRRKKELGVYMSLGMSKRKISSILLVETFLIGLISLGTGLILGIALSQGLSLVTAKLFVTNIKKFAFVFSASATIKTILYFSLIFLLVMIFNTMSISKYKLIDLLNAHRKSEQLKIKKVSVSIILFVLSIISLIIAYRIILNMGLEFDSKFVLSIFLGCLGTLLFFISLSGFLLNTLKLNKSIYFKNLNVFTLRQLNSKVNTNYVSMTLICLMLFFTISVLSTSFSFKSALETSLVDSNPFSASVCLYSDDNLTSEPITNILKENGFNIDKYSKDYVNFTEYKSDVPLNSILAKYADSSSKKKFETMYESNVSAISISDFNKILKLEGKKEYSLKDNEVLFCGDMNLTLDTLASYLDNTSKIKIDGKDFDIQNKKLITDSLETNYFATNFLTFVLPDNTVKNMPVSREVLNINYASEDAEKAFQSIINKPVNISDSSEDSVLLLGSTKIGNFENSNYLSTLAIYVGIYIGIIFLISSAAVLALQQLSDATDNVDKYDVLRKIGVSKKMINRSIFSQIFVYFMLPISLAIVHSIIGIKVASTMVSMFGNQDILIPSLITGGLICIIYGGYFTATYLGYKNVINK